MKILLLCSAYPNYVPDLLLHGLRKLFGAEVVDYPRKDSVYQGICGPPNLDPIPGLMADDSAVDRTDIPAKIAAGFFQLVLCDLRAFHDNLALLQNCPSPLALIDGEDFPAPIRPGPYAVLRRETDGSDHSIPLPMAMPIEGIAWIDRHAGAPKTHSVAFLGSRSPHTPDRNALLDDMARIFPDGMIGSWAVGDASPGRDGYYRNLQSCQVVISLPGAGLDTFRYWENASCNAVHAAKEMALYIPDPFRDGRELITFTNLSDLAASVEKVLSGRIDGLALRLRSRERLLAHHTTDKRAAYVIDRLKQAFSF
jgi:hypothetical protein